MPWSWTRVAQIQSGVCTKPSVVRRILHVQTEEKSKQRVACLAFVSFCFSTYAHALCLSLLIWCIVFSFGGFRFGFECIICFNFLLTYPSPSVRSLSQTLSCSFKNFNNNNCLYIAGSYRLYVWMCCIAFQIVSPSWLDRVIIMYGKIGEPNLNPC